MKKVGILFFVLVVLVIGLYSLSRQKSKSVEESKPEEVFHRASFPIEARFFHNHLVVLTKDGTLSFYDLYSQKITPYNFPPDLFDSIYHFSFAALKDKAFVVGSKLINDQDVIRYGLIDLQKYTLTWFEESVITKTLGKNYQVNSFVLDSAGNNVLFSMTNPDETESQTQQYYLVAVDPKAGSVVPLRTLIGENVSLKYYSSRDNTLAYNKESQDTEIGVLGSSIDPAEQTISHIESLSIFPDDVVVGTYTPSNALAFSSITAPDRVRLTISPEGGYSLISPSVVRSINGNYTAYHLWKPVSREGIVSVMQTDQGVVFELPVQGSVELFFSPDGKKLLLVTQQANPEGIAPRQGVLVDLASFQSSEVMLPESINSIIGWY